MLERTLGIDNFTWLLHIADEDTEAQSPAAKLNVKKTGIWRSVD